MYKPCNCVHPHLTREHLFTQIKWTKDGQNTFSMVNPYFIGLKSEKVVRRGRPCKSSVEPVVTSTTQAKSSTAATPQSTRWTPKVPSKVSTFHQTNGRPNGKRVNRKPLQYQQTTIRNPINGSFVSPLKSSTTTVATLPAVKSKYDVWHSIRSTFQEYRKLCKTDSTINGIHHNKVIHQPIREKDDHYNKNWREEADKWTSPFERIPFRSPPASINGVTVFSMKNPFVNKSKSKVSVPIDELTRLYYETIDTIDEEEKSIESSMEIDSSIDQLIKSSILPLIPVSPTSPISTTSLFMENHLTPTKIRFEDETELEIKVEIEGRDTVIFKEVNDFNNLLPQISTTIFDDICITDFNEYEFDQMISNLPDII